MGGSTIIARAGKTTPLGGVGDPLPAHHARDARFIDLPFHPHGREANPALRDFLGRPRERYRGINVDHHMQVIAHHCIGVDADREDLRQLQQAILDPLLAVFEAAPGQLIRTAQERAANAARDGGLRPLYCELHGFGRVERGTALRLRCRPSVVDWGLCVELL